jgi:3-oxoacyl-[acyl-carrier protein] reductase
MDLGLKNKKILIVGSSKGIGREIAIKFASEGAQIFCIARSEDLLIDLINEANQINGLENFYRVSDLMIENPNSVSLELLNKYGVFDIVVHNVGGSLVSRNYLGTIEEWTYAWMFNAGIAINMNNVLIEPMIKNGWGRVIHISSISAEMLRGNPLYASSKAFLNAYVKTVGRAIANTGVIMNAIMPGAVAFPGSYWDKYLVEDPDRCNDFLSHHQAVNRFGNPEEIANVVVFLASDKATFMQASLVPVDGANM